MVRAGGPADLLSARLLLVVFSFDAYAPAIFVEGGIIAVSGGFLAIAAAILTSCLTGTNATI